MNLFDPKICVTASLMFVALAASPQATAPEKNISTSSRSDVTYKQEHSSGLTKQSGLFADGLKLKMDLSILEEVKAERELSPLELDPKSIPAEDVYGGLWPTSHVAAYGALTEVPDSFVVDLSNFSIPCKGYMTSNFGRRGSRRYHYGVDLKAQTGDTIYAAFDGKVRVKDFERRGYGNYIVLRHPNGLETVYGHLSAFLIKENDVVRSGEPIGLAGNTGRSFGSHLHFEFRFCGKPINPNFIVDFENKVCHRDEYLVTDSSYKKTTASSSVRYKSASTSVQSTKNANNKYVSGSVKYHRVKKGDTLGTIASRYGVSVSKLCSLNNITSRATLHVGKSLRIS
ncbi:MAG: peptidoglycan DD-metalloendopeptidase family protein [Dysgonamonadaceae bacterium]|nr:peptidoglycan DD-metalloendopeptidase family protein [Dysgonamonadaceae bacterium]